MLHLIVNPVAGNGRAEKISHPLANRWFFGIMKVERTGRSGPEIF